MQKLILAFILMIFSAVLRANTIIDHHMNATATPASPAAVSQAIAQKKQVSQDQAITTDINAALKRDAITHDTNIVAETNQGIVTLTGNTPRKIEADTAIKIADKTAGVIKVIDKVEIKR